jgi:hypothetical protein
VEEVAKQFMERHSIVGDLRKEEVIGHLKKMYEPIKEA